MYGGVVQTVNHIAFELVATPDGALVYTLDHDEPVDASRYDGKLTVLNGADKAEAPVLLANGNLVESGDLPGAEEAFLQAGLLWRAGAAAFPGILDEARIRAIDDSVVGT